MPEYPDTITPAQYDQYTSDWAALIETGNDDALRPAFQAPNGERFTFLTFSLDQVVALVTAPGARSIKARFLLMPDTMGTPRFSLALFASDEAPDNIDTCLSAYYIPTPAQATSTQHVERSAGPDTSVPADEAKQRLNAWVQNELTTELFNTDSGPLKGGNFTVSTFQDPLAAAWPYADKTLFVNLGLIYDPELTSDLVVYIAPLSSRQQGSTAGLPDDGYYNTMQHCPPNH
jgi:hypothetical protein